MVGWEIESHPRQKDHDTLLQPMNCLFWGLTGTSLGMFDELKCCVNAAAEGLSQERLSLPMAAVESSTEAF